MAVYYNTCVDYIRCANNAKEKIARINEIIELLEDNILDSALKNKPSEYSLNDGQTTIKEVFNSVESIENAILALEKRKQRIINRCVGYRYGLMDGKVIMR